MASRRSLPMFLVFAVSLLCGFGLIAPAAPVQAADPIIVDDFETPLRQGCDGTHQDWVQHLPRPEQQRGDLDSRAAGSRARCERPQ